MEEKGFKMKKNGCFDKKNALFRKKVEKSLQV